MYTKTDDPRHYAYEMSQWKLKLRMREDGNKIPIWMKADPVPSKEPFSSPEDLWRAAQEYFSFASHTKITSAKKHITKGGKIVTIEDDHPRAFTLQAFAAFCNTSVRRINKLRGIEEYADVLDLIDHTIFMQKFEYAAVNLMNASLIARDLDLSEKLDIGGGKTPLRTINVNKLSTNALEEILNAQEDNPE